MTPEQIEFAIGMGAIVLIMTITLVLLGGILSTPDHYESPRDEDDYIDD